MVNTTDLRTTHSMPPNALQKTQGKETCGLWGVAGKSPMVRNFSLVWGIWKLICHSAEVTCEDAWTLQKDPGEVGPKGNQQVSFGESFS